MTTNIAPLDTRHAVTYNAFATGNDAAKATRFDAAIRLLITMACGSGQFKKIAAIKVFRDLAVCFGVEVGLLEAKNTIDAMQERMIIETLRDLLSVRVGSEPWNRFNATLDALDPNINFQKKAQAARALAEAEAEQKAPKKCVCGSELDAEGFCTVDTRDHDMDVQGR
jgi:ribosomal protein L7/L12